MKTVVFQSFRTERVPDWLTACMRTVRAWADAKSFDYRFYDDAFLDVAPAWLRERCAGEICPVTDIARLIMSRRLLDEGYERAVWVDADMLVFAPDVLPVNSIDGYALCLELWPYIDAQGKLQCDRRINNSITVFARGNPQLDFLIDACMKIASSRAQVGKFDLGTEFLTRLGQIVPLPLLPNVGMFSPVLMNAIAHGEDTLLSAYAAQLSAPLVAANLCNSIAGTDVQGSVAGHAVYDAVVEQCLATRGGVVNRWLSNQ
jgi:hypothetical protein